MLPIHYTSSFKAEYLYNYFNTKIFLDINKFYALGIYIEPAFDYFNLWTNIVLYSHDLVHKLSSFINQISCVNNQHKFKSLQIKIILPVSFLPLFTEESFCNDNTKFVINVFYKTYALQKSIYHLWDFMVNDKDHRYLVIASVFRLEKNNCELKNIQEDSKNFNDANTNYIVHYFSNYTKKLIEKNKLIDVNVALVEYLTEEIVSSTIRLKLLEEYKNIYFNNQKLKINMMFY